MFFLPKLNWVCNKLPLTEAVPRKKAGCYLELKSSWFIWPGSFLETVFPGPWCPGERLQWAARPKDCGTGMLRNLLSSLAVGGREETTDEDASSRTWVLFLTGHQKHLGIFFFLLQSNMLAFPLLSPQTHFWPFSSWSVPKDAEFRWWGFLAPWPTESCAGEASSQRQKGRGIGGLSPCLPRRSAVPLLGTEPLLSGRGPRGRSSPSAPLFAGSSDTNPLILQLSGSGGFSLLPASGCLTILVWSFNPPLSSKNHFMKASPLNYMTVNPCLGLAPETVTQLASGEAPACVSLKIIPDDSIS